MGFKGSVCLSQEGFHVLVALAPKQTLFFPRNFRCFINSSNFFQLLHVFPLSSPSQDFDLNQWMCLFFIHHITFFVFPLLWSHLLQESSFFLPALFQGAAV